MSTDAVMCFSQDGSYNTPCHRRDKESDWVKFGDFTFTNSVAKGIIELIQSADTTDWDLYSVEEILAGLPAIPLQVTDEVIAKVASFYDQIDSTESFNGRHKLWQPKTELIEILEQRKEQFVFLEGW